MCITHEYEAFTSGGGKKPINSLKCCFWTHFVHVRYCQINWKKKIAGFQNLLDFGQKAVGSGIFTDKQTGHVKVWSLNYRYISVDWLLVTLTIHPFVHLLTCHPAATCQSAHLFTYLSIYPSIYTSTCLSICLSILPSFYPSTHSPTSLSSQPANQPLVHLSIHLPNQLPSKPSPCPSLHPRTHMWIYPSILPSSLLPTHQCVLIHPYVYLSVHLAVHVPIPSVSSFSLQNAF